MFFLQRIFKTVAADIADKKRSGLHKFKHTFYSRERLQKKSPTHFLQNCKHCLVISDSFKFSFCQWVKISSTWVCKHSSGSIYMKHDFRAVPCRRTPCDMVGIDPYFGCMVLHNMVWHKNHVLCKYPWGWQLLSYVVKDFKNIPMFYCC
jgi:hypothetical protein